MSERDLSSISRQAPTHLGMVDFLPVEDRAQRSCPAGTGQSLNGALREFVRLIAQIVVDDLLDGQGDEAAHPTLQQPTTGPFGPEKEDV